MENLPYITILLVLTLALSTAINLSHGKATICCESYNFKYTGMARCILFFAYVLFIIFAVFRVIDVGLGGIDAFAYKQIFLTATGKWIDALKFQQYEYGYGTIIWFFRLITENYEIVLFFFYTAMFIMIVKYAKYITWNKFTFLSIFLLLTLTINSFNTLRVITAIFIGMIDYILLHKKKYRKAIFVAILAVSIHISALILFPMILICIIMNKKSKISFTRLVIYVVLVSVIASIAIVFMEKFITGSRYHIYNSEDGIAVGTYVITILVFISSGVKYRQMVELNSFNRTLITILPVCLIVLPLQIKYSILYRMVLYFLPIIYTLIPSLLEVYTRKDGNIFNFAIKIGLLLYIIIRLKIFLTVELVSAGLPYVNSLINLFQK